MLKRNAKRKELEENADEEDEEAQDSGKKTNIYEIKEGIEFAGSKLQIRKRNKYV